MAYRSFSHFIEELERMSELVRIAEPVATELEITEMADRQMKAPGGGKALLFEKPTIDGRISPFPVAINTMGSARRMARAIGLESIDEIAHQMQLILKAKPPTSMRQGWSLLKQGIDLQFFPEGSADLTLLAEGRGSFYHVAHCVHQRSRHRGAEHRDVPDAAL
jgi:4-hydroxy-3-polyprenylbenzoate decarboxylase